MNPSYDLARLKGRSLFVGTPMYDGKCHSEFAFSIARLTALCTQTGIDLRFYFSSHDALVTKARNGIVDEFLESGCAHLLFVDADIGFDPRDAVTLLAMQALDARAPAFDVIAAPYPLKHLSWSRVLKAARSGLADGDPDRLARYSSAVPISLASGTTFQSQEPTEVSHAATGFMMIRRETFERFRAHHPGRGYRIDRGGTTRATHDLYAFFETEVDSKQGHIVDEIRAYAARFPQASAADMLAFVESDEALDDYSGRFFSEDYAFCRAVRAAGMKVWLCPWMELTHTGSHRFTARLADLAAIGPV